MISDYVDPQKYSQKELDEEAVLIRTIQQEIQACGKYFEYIEIKNLADLKKSLKKFNTTEVVIFNWCEFLEEKEDTAHLVTKYLESQGFIFTGADTRCLKLTASKEETKKKLIENNILTPKYTVVKKEGDLANIGLSYPLILKLENRHASAGITNENVVYNDEQLNKMSKKLFSRYHTNILLEEFIEGQEYAVTVWGNGCDASVLTCATLSYTNKEINQTYTQASKEDTASKDYANTIITIFDYKKDKKVIENIPQTVLDAYRALGFFDYGRFDLIEKNGQYYVLDCNPNEYIGPDSFLYHGSKQFGYNFGETILQICEFAVKRYMK